MTNNNTHKGNEMFEKLTSEDLIADMDNYNDALEMAEAQLELEMIEAGEVEENYEHGDYRDELLQDELDMIDEFEDDDLIDSVVSFDDMLNGFNQFDDQRDFDFYDS